MNGTPGDCVDARHHAVGKGRPGAFRHQPRHQPRQRRVALRHARRREAGCAARPARHRVQRAGPSEQPDVRAAEAVGGVGARDAARDPGALPRQRQLPGQGAARHAAGRASRCATTTARVVPGKDPMGRTHYWFTVVPVEATEEGTDRWAFEQGYVSHDAARARPHRPCGSSRACRSSRPGRSSSSPAHDPHRHLGLALRARGAACSIPKACRSAASSSSAARHFPTVEINGSFYSLQRPEYYERVVRRDADGLPLRGQGLALHHAHAAALEASRSRSPISSPPASSICATSWGRSSGSFRRCSASTRERLERVLRAAAAHDRARRWRSRAGATRA